MAHWKAHVDADSEWLRFHDIEGKSPVTCEVSAFSDEEVYEPNEKVKGTMLFLAFKGGSKRLGINHTNGWLIEQVTGKTDPQDWIGKKITLRTAFCKGEDCIRVDTPSGTKMLGRYPKFNYTDKKAK